MKIGILYEGCELNALQILINRILETEIQFKRYFAGGPIDSKMELARIMFFEGEDICDFAVFIGDNDGNKKRKTKIAKWVNGYNSRFGQRIIFVCPDPHFEQWFIYEEQTIKNLLGLSGSSPLPHPTLSPKDRLASIFAQNSGDDPVMTLLDFYSEISKNIRLEILGHEPNFGKFQEDLKQAVRIFAQI